MFFSDFSHGITHQRISFVIATSSSRRGSAVRSKWIGVLICWQLAGVEGRFVREIMLLLDGISVGGQRTRERKREFSPVRSVTKLSSLCKCLASTELVSTVAMRLPARAVARSSTPTTASTDTIRLCVASLTIGRVFFLPLLHVAQGIPLPRSSSIWMCEGRRSRRGQFWPAPGRGQTYSTLSNGSLLCWFLINKNLCNFFYFVSHDFWSTLIINVASKSHIILLLY